MQGLEPRVLCLYTIRVPTRLHEALVGRFALKKVVLILRILTCPQEHKLDLYTSEGDTAGQHLGN